MTEKIGVTYQNVRLFGWHMALFYERNDGSKTVIEFSPAWSEAGKTGSRISLHPGYFC
jgi:hypothetical protein